MEPVILSDKIKEIFGKPDIGKKFIREILSMGHNQNNETASEEQSETDKNVKEEEDGSYTLKVDGHTFNVSNVAVLDKSN